MGRIVNKGGRPLVWRPGELPFHVTDASKLKVICPMKYRNYAHRLEHDVPYWREKVTLSPFSATSAAVNFLAGTPAVASESSASTERPPGLRSASASSSSSSPEAAVYPQLCV